MSKRSLVLVPAGAMAVVLALASVAWACTAIRGNAQVDSVSNERCGPISPSRPPECASTNTWASVTGYGLLTGFHGVAPGDTMDVSGNDMQLKYSNGTTDVEYALYWLNHLATDADQMLTCMGNTLVNETRLTPAGSLFKPGSNSGTPSTYKKIAAQSVTVPAATDTSAATGPAVVCWISSTLVGGTATPDYVFATNPDYLTVVAP